MSRPVIIPCAVSGVPPGVKSSPYAPLICKCLAGEGVGRRGPKDRLPGARRVAAESRANDGREEPFLIGVASFDSVAGVVAAVVQTFGGIDVVVNNACAAHQIENR